MLRQLPEPILGAWGAPELEGEVPGIVSEAGLQPSSEGNGAFVCPCVRKAAPMGSLASLQDSPITIGCSLHPGDAEGKGPQPKWGLGGCF